MIWLGLQAPLIELVIYILNISMAIMPDYFCC